VGNGPTQLIEESYMEAILSLPVYEDGHQVTSRRLIFPEQPCPGPLTFLDASGRISTGADGTRGFRLSNFLCDINSFSEPVFLVATPKTTSACHVTLTHELIRDPTDPNSFSDVEITAFTWKPDGTPAPNIAFDWRCRVVSNPITF
jgi:hypothetical protein